LSNDQLKAQAIKNAHGIEYYPTRKDPMQKGFQRIGRFTCENHNRKGVSIAAETVEKPLLKIAFSV